MALQAQLNDESFIHFLIHVSHFEISSAIFPQIHIGTGDQSPKLLLTQENKDNFTPIKVLNTFIRDWIILARVAFKSDLKT